MAIVAPIEQLQPVEARAIIEHLRRGSVPIEQVPFFTVGRERWLSLIEDDLAHYIAPGGAAGTPSSIDLTHGTNLPE